jgi:hypothetical protein
MRSLRKSKSSVIYSMVRKVHKRAILLLETRDPLVGVFVRDSPPSGKKADGFGGQSSVQSRVGSASSEFVR